jgi:hypothetical protein
MCDCNSTDARWIKRTFLAVEAFVVLACFYGLALRMAWRYDVGERPHVMTAYRVLFPLLFPMLFAFVMACGVLLLGAPFLVRRLGRVALVAWGIGAVAFLSAICLLRF